MIEVVEEKPNFLVYIIAGVLIIGALILIAFLVMICFVACFNWFADLMITKGADESIASVVSFLVTICIFFGVPKQVNNIKIVKNKLVKKEDG